MKKEFLTYEWRKAQEEFNLSIISPHCIDLSNGKKLESVMLISSTIAKYKGILIFYDYDMVEPYTTEIINLGYGYSILDKEDNNDEYDRGAMHDMLLDWGLIECTVQTS